MSTAASELPAWLADAPPLAQAAGVFLFTFVSEDAAAVGSALLHAAGSLPWSLAFAAAMLGIWLGDAGLYWLARGVGRPLLDRSWARRWFDPVRVARAEQWFSQRGAWALVSSRIVPGTRLPTYLAAGFLRMPFGRFLAVTGAAVLAWTLLVFALVGWLGADVLRLLERWKFGGFALLAAVLAGVLLLRLGLTLADARARRRQGAALQRWSRWEFWPAWLFYPPVVLWCGWLMLRHRGIRLPGFANPGIFAGGIVGESKLETLRELSQKFPASTAAAVEVPAGTVAERLAVVRAAFPYPFILKPDMGQRGVGVKLVRDEAQVVEYLRQTGAPLVAQAYAPGPHEAGVFYYRFPGAARGHIFAITAKIFPHVTGDGTDTVEELVWRDPRARLIAGKYLARLGDRAQSVLPAGESLRLVEAGNHAQGCIFEDGAHLGSAELAARIDEISRGLTGFFIGRYDLRYTSDGELRAGRGFQIIELNGAASEATNIYDARTPLWRAYRTLFQQWSLVFRIGAANRALGAEVCTVREVWARYREFLRRAATYPLAD